MNRLVSTPRVCCLVAIVGLISPAQAQQGKPLDFVPISVRVFTATPAPGALIPIDQKEREESVQQLLNELDDWTQLKLPTGSLVFVNTPAALEVEVLDRKADDDDYVVHYRVVAGDYTFPLEGINDDAHWKDCADDAAKKLAKWILWNREQLITIQKTLKPLA